MSSAAKHQFSASLEDCMFDFRENESGAGGVAGVKLIVAEASDMNVVRFSCNSQPNCAFVAQSTCQYEYSPILSLVPHQ